MPLFILFDLLRNPVFLKLELVVYTQLIAISNKMLYTSVTHF